MASATTIVSVLATLASVCMMSAPLATVRKMEQQQSIGIMTPIFFCAQFVSCVIWSVYGVFLNDLSVIFSNVVGNGVAVYCLLVFLSIARQEEKSGHQLTSSTYRSSWMTALFALTIAIAASTAVTFLVGVKWKFALTLNGLLGSFCSVVMLSSPLAMVGTIMKTKNAEGLAPLTMTFALVNTFLWFLYGILTYNPFLVIPQMLGILSCILQFAFLFKYGQRPSQASELKSAVAPVPFMG